MKQKFPKIKRKTKREIQKEQRIRMKEWEPILMEDYDWDYSYFLIILSFKLKRMEALFRKSKMHEGNLEFAKQIKEAKVLIDKVYNDDYRSICLKELDEKYGKMKCIKKGFKNTDSLETLLSRPKRTKDNEVQYSKDLRNAYDKAEKMKKDDLKKAFAIIAENIFCWWD